jgi:hypothetical protein
MLLGRSWDGPEMKMLQGWSRIGDGTLLFISTATCNKTLSPNFFQPNYITGVKASYVVYEGG